MKTKSKFNIIDFFILVVVAGIIAVAVWFFMPSNDGDEVYVYFTVEIRETMPNFVDSVPIASMVRDSVRNYSLGYVWDVNTTPTVFYTLNHQTLEMAPQEVFDRYNTYITIRAEGVLSNSEIGIGQTSVRVGQRMYLRGLGFAGFGFVTDLRWEER